MNVYTEKFKVELSSEETWDILFSLKRRLESTTTKHWVNFIKDKTKQEFVDMVMKEESHILNLIYSFSNILDRSDLGERDTTYTIGQVWEKHNDNPLLNGG